MGSETYAETKKRRHTPTLDQVHTSAKVQQGLAVAPESIYTATVGAAKVDPCSANHYLMRQKSADNSNPS